MSDTPLPKAFHAHVYFDDHQAPDAEQLCTTLSQKFDLKMGRVHNGPVGPHPRGSCQISVPVVKLADTLQWLMMNRGEFTVFVHAITGDDWIDHTQGVMWLGASETLKLDIFRQK